MFDNLSDKLDQTLKRLRGHGKISASNVEDAVRDVRLALLEADVQLDVVKGFTARVLERSLGTEVLQSLTPEQHFIKIVRDELTALMGGSETPLDLGATPPVPLLLLGLQGAGKTTSIAKLGIHLRDIKGRRPYLVPADVRRPAAIEQLQTLGEQAGLPVYPTQAGQDPVEVCKAALQDAHNKGYDTLLIDSAGRLHIDDELMGELQRIDAAVHAHQKILVLDAMTGQDAVNVAQGFHDALGLSGVLLTKLDGDARGGAALSVREVTGAPILFVGTGEKLDALEVFHPERMATRILGMGDVLTLIEKAEQAFDEDKALQLEKKLKRNEFTIEDYREQMNLIRSMGNIQDLVGMIPGMKKMVKGADLSSADGEFRRIEAIICSMTRQERGNHLIINGSRRKRIAGGSGTSVTEVNKFLKQFVQIKKVMRQMAKKSNRGMFGGLR